MPNSLKTARNISDAEAAVVERALEVSPTDDSASKLHSMVRSLQIISRCKCGCASIDFCSAMPGQVSRIVAEAAGIGPAGEDLGLIVWALDGTLSSLEVYSYSEHPAPLPVVASISPIGGDAAQMLSNFSIKPTADAAAYFWCQAPHRMLKNPEVKKFFKPLSAHSDVAEELLKSLRRLGEYEVVQANALEYGAFYAVTSQVAFCGASGMRDTYWRLRPSDRDIAIASGAEPASIGAEWIKIECFRSNWPNPDLMHWALRAYDYARTGA